MIHGRKHRAWALAGGIAALPLTVLVGTPVLAQGNVTPQAGTGQEGASPSAPVWAGTTTEVTTGASGAPQGGSAPKAGAGQGPQAGEGPQVGTDRSAGRNGDCRGLPARAEAVACLQGYAAVLSLAGGAAGGDTP